MKIIELLIKKFLMIKEIKPLDPIQPYVRLDGGLQILPFSQDVDDTACKENVGTFRFIKTDFVNSVEVCMQNGTNYEWVVLVTKNIGIH